MKKRKYTPSDNIIINHLSRIIGLTNLIKRFQIGSLDVFINNENCKSLLDVGCGSGYMTLYVSDAINAVTGVDLRRNSSWSAISRLAKNIKFYTVDEYVTNRASFDVLLLSEVMGELGDLSKFTDFYDFEFENCKEVILITSFSRSSITETMYTLQSFFSRIFSLKEKSKDDFMKSFYDKILNRFSDNELRFFQKNEYTTELKKYSLTLNKEIYNFSKSSIFVFEFTQMVLSIFGLKPYGKRLLILYPLIKILNYVDKSRSDQYAILHFTKK